MDFFTWLGKKFGSCIAQQKQTTPRSSELSESWSSKPHKHNFPLITQENFSMFSTMANDKLRVPQRNASVHTGF